jgi:hypothetical protein
VGESLNQSQKRALRIKARSATLKALQALGGEARRQAIREWALAHGGFSPLEFAAPPPEAVAGKYSSRVDYELQWALTNLKHDGLVENPKWGTWRLTDAAREATTNAASKPVGGDRLAELDAMPYRQYLRTPEWKRTRGAALLRAGYACSMDVTHTEGLEVHHRTYERRGAELPADLVVLCHACHQLHHGEYGRPRRGRSRTPSPLQPTENVLGPRSRTTPQRPGRQSLLRRLLTKLTPARTEAG